ncbi:ADP-ribosylglycohydrolase family protein [Dermabacter hominis]|uniref:ADP-ribosylglycohydrolase family protein n=1 Tax=Dermabacter hominis TaxID=36740 RepID=UPI00242FDC52|nr:ADP-ribosylglycohydrolase family protein [Dermabacter hominis]
MSDIAPSTEATAAREPERPHDPHSLSQQQRERALGAVLGAATGDALGAPYEFEPPIADSDDVAMTGGGQLGWKPGEWTDDTAMAIVIMRAAAHEIHGDSLTSESSLDAIAAGWYQWSRETPDIGILTSNVLVAALETAQSHGNSVPSGRDMHEAARAIHKAQHHTAGNGGLMRAYSVVLPYLLASEDEFERAVVFVNTLTHVDLETIEAAVLWSFAIRHAILTGELTIDAGLGRLTPERRDYWRGLIAEAHSAPPAYFARNGWVIHAFQGAVSALCHAGDVPEDKFERRAYFTRVVEAAVRSGNDTDTVAAIAGALAGAVVGYKAIDPVWRRALNGWPGFTEKDLAQLALAVIERFGAS